MEGQRGRNRRLLTSRRSAAGAASIEPELVDPDIDFPSAGDIGVRSVGVLTEIERATIRRCEGRSGFTALKCGAIIAEAQHERIFPEAREHERARCRGAGPDVRVIDAAIEGAAEIDLR